MKSTRRGRLAVVTDRGHGREGPVMDGVVTDHGLAGLPTDVVVHLMEQDPHEKALDYSVSRPREASCQRGAVLRR